MIKKKLTLKRIEKNFTQEEIGYQLGISQSQYSRRERGTTKITASEWNKLAKILDSDVALIYEPDENIDLIYQNEKNNGGNLHTEKDSSDFTFIIMKKYIEKLEHENKKLKSKL
ncbi:transcriptional regulator with XRE-family HTH domain [Flavobacterium sp. 2755]|uniref:helix-turn-helix transcriptional regulator n=1 Tax=Flavobacterium sp. 2755 TaxID=2817765 RepID=UPI002861222D|nr:helix-turn-helix transcriptional regulator [Flavobacterium sp. 2755]MDR6761958.1 transcriptional regulator with XRE-family HTH domain [Flavobacterium sp. 2755]